MIILAVESLVMKKMFLIVCWISLVNISFAQTDTATLNDINRFQKELIDEYKNETTSPLSKKAKKEFKGIHFFPVDMQYVVTAKFVRTANEKIFAMPTSGNVTKQYVKFGEATFTMQDKEYKLNIYQSIDLASQRKYRDYIFIKFNKDYHPYCAYIYFFN